MTDAEALTIAELGIGEYSVIRGDYKNEIGAAILDYLFTDNARITKYRSTFKRAIADNFDAAFSLGYSDAGGDIQDMDADAQAWLAAKIDAEFGHVDMLFQQLKGFKADEETTVDDYNAEAERRAEGYARTLDGVYSEGKLRGGKDVLAIMDGEDGEENCPECKKYKGQKHKVSWWIKRGLVPGQPGNASYTCRGYACQHFLYNAKTGEVLTI